MAERPPVSRRSLLQMSMLAVPGAAVLAACARSSSGGGGTPASASGGSPAGSASSGGLVIASPQNPVTWPISPDNPPIAAGLEPEANATLRLYNYPDYIDPGVVKGFEKQYADYGVKVEISTFNDYSEAMTKLRSGGVPYDVFFPSYNLMGRMVLGGLIQPLQHSYIPGIANVWPEFTNPFYDQGWLYTVPYNLYTTGIGWRSDKVTEDIGARANPYDVFWDPQYRERLAVLDDDREVIAMTLLRNGVSNVNTDSDAELNAARDAMLQMNQVTKPRVTITDYTDIPEGRLDLSQAWSGDMLTARWYLPDGVDETILRYWFPKDGKGLVNNDLITVLKGSQNPVLAHLFLDYMLGEKAAMKNFEFNGYQPPQNSITPANLVKSGFIPENLAPAIVLPEYFNNGYRILELPPDTEAKYAAIWQQFKAGA